MTIFVFYFSNFENKINFLLVLVNKLEYVTKSLRGIHKTLRKSTNFESDENSDLYTTTQQLGSVLEAIVDVVNRLEHPENVQEQKSEFTNFIKFYHPHHFLTNCIFLNF